MNNIYPDLIIYGYDKLSTTCKFKTIIEFSDTKISETTITDVTNICSTFASAGGFGAYAIDEDRENGLTSYDGQIFLQENSVISHFIISNLNYKAFHFYRNMLMMLYEKNVHISSINISAIDYHGDAVLKLREITHTNESEEYLNVTNSPDIPEIIWQTLEFSKSRRVLIEFYARPSSKQFDTLKCYIDAWYNLLEKGAFSSPFGFPFETLSVRGILSLFDEVTYEISISRYIASEIGFKVLSNMLKHFSKNVLSIVKVEID